MLFTFQVAFAVSAAKNPVVCVHGYTGNGSNFDSIRSYLQGQGWTNTYAITYANTNDPSANVSNAQQLNTYINNVLQITGKSKVDIVCHSMGGLSSRYYLQNITSSKVGAIVSLGSPHHGVISNTGDLWMYSSFLTALNAGDVTPGNVNCTSIYSSTDELVPTWSAYMPQWNNVRLTGLGHIMLLTSSTVNYYIKANLTK